MQTVVKQPEVAVAYYTVKDVMGILGCKQTKAQDIIRQLNDEELILLLSQNVRKVTVYKKQYIYHMKKLRNYRKMK